MTSAKWWKVRSHKRNISSKEEHSLESEAACQSFAPNAVILLVRKTVAANAIGSLQAKEQYQMPEDAAKVYEYIEANNEKGLRAYLESVGATKF